MSHTLFLTGALAPKAMKRYLETRRGPIIVLEFDTLLDRAQFPNVTAWTTIREILGPEDFKAIRQEVLDALKFYLRHRPDMGDQAGDCQLRKALIHGAFLDGAYTLVMNTLIFNRLRERFSWDRLVVTAGCGVHFDFWRQTAAEHGMEIEILPPEPFRRGLRRRLEKWYYKHRSTKTPKTESSPRTSGTDAGGKLTQVVCTSRRVSKLLKCDGSNAKLRVEHLSMQDLGTPDPVFYEAEKRRFSEWWARWESGALESASAEEKEQLAKFKPLYSAMGSSLIHGVYPRWSALRRNAQTRMQANRPEALITDTQMAEEETIWQLAAHDLGIPVIAYSYDYVVNASFMLAPDYALMDGMRSIPHALVNGYPIERIINVRSHRLPHIPCRTLEETDAIFSSAHPQVLFADLPSIIRDPQLSMRCFRVIVDAARALPQMQFIVKFHPLRAAKSELRSFVGMDESEVHAKMQYIRELHPPNNVSMLAPEADMEEQLKSSAVLLNTLSLSGHQAFRMGVPVIFMLEHNADFLTFPKLAHWMEVQRVQDGAELVTTLTRFITSSEFRQKQIEGQGRYHDDYYWPSSLSLEEGIFCALDKLRENAPPNG